MVSYQSVFVVIYHTHMESRVAAVFETYELADSWVSKSPTKRGYYTINETEYWEYSPDPDWDR